MLKYIFRILDIQECLWITLKPAAIECARPDIGTRLRRYCEAAAMERDPTK